MATLKWIVPEPTTTEQLNAIDARHVHPVLRAMLDNREAWYQLPPGASESRDYDYSSTVGFMSVYAIEIGVFTLPMEMRTTGDGRKWYRAARTIEWDRLAAFMNANAED